MVSFFASLSMIIWGSKNKYCLSFGFIFLGITTALLSGPVKDRLEKELIKINDSINEIDVDESMSEEEKVYVLKQLYVAQKKTTRMIKRSQISFVVAGVSFVLLGIFGMI